MLGELLRSARVGRGGVEGDRRWVVADARTGERIASKRGPTDERLRACRAELEGDGKLIAQVRAEAARVPVDRRSRSAAGARASRW